MGENSFNMVGDGDNVDVVNAVEKAFQIRLSDDEAQSCETFGELFDVVCTKLPQLSGASKGCPNAVSFFRLRSAFRKLGFTGTIAPATDLRDWFRAYGARRLRNDLGRAARLEAPMLELSPFNGVVVESIFYGGMATAVFVGAWTSVGVGFGIAVGALLAMVALAPVLPQMLPRRIATMRDFAADCAAWNYGALLEQCGGATRKDVWNALAIVVRESSATGYQGTIDRDTRFIAKSWMD